MDHLLMLLLLLLQRSSGSYPRAQNVTWKSTNFKTFLTWEPKPSANYSYTVEFSAVGGDTQRSHHCIRSSETVCDLSSSLPDLHACYTADVLSEPPLGVSSDLFEFPHSSSPRFCPYTDTDIGRPDFKLEVSEDKKKTTLYVTDPLTARFKDGRQLSIRDIFSHQLQYKVTYRSNKSTGKKTYDSKTKEIELTGLDRGDSYCFSVQAYIPSRSASKQLGEMSQIKCSHNDDPSILEDSVRLVNGTSLCSGRLEVKSNQSTQSTQWWSSVCEEDFDQQDAEVVCRELGCGAPSVLQGALYGEVEAPMWPKEFQCGGHESALLDCRSSGSERNTCSPGKAVGLTCSEPVRLVGGASRCAGTLEVKRQGDWRPVGGSDWTLKRAAVVCRDLDCGSAVSTGRRDESSERNVWWIINFNCVQSASHLRECVTTSSLSSFSLDLTCSDLLLQPIISMDGVSEAQQQGAEVLRRSAFTIVCSIQPQYPGGSFQLTFSNSPQNYTQPAVNHSAHFLFPAADPAHQGSYSCVYHVSVSSHDFSSESRLLSLTVLDPAPFIIRVVVLPLTLLLVNTALYFYCKASRGQKPGRRENIELDYYNMGVHEEGAQGAE